MKKIVHCSTSVRSLVFSALRRTIVLALIGGVLSPGVLAQSTGDYVIGPHDVLTVQVFEKYPSPNEMFKNKYADKSSPLIKEISSSTKNIDLDLPVN